MTGQWITIDGKVYALCLTGGALWRRVGVIKPKKVGLWSWDFGPEWGSK